MYYVFGSKEADGSLTYFKDEFGNSVFKLDSMQDAAAAIDVAYATNPDYELYKLVPASANLCEC